MIDFQTRVAHSPRAVMRELAGSQGAVVLDLDSAEYYGLDEMASTVWRLIGEGGTTVSAIVSTLTTMCDDCPPDVAGEVAMFVEELAQRRLVTLAPGRRDDS